MCVCVCVCVFLMSKERVQAKLAFSGCLKPVESKIKRAQTSKETGTADLLLSLRNEATARDVVNQSVVRSSYMTMQRKPR